MAEVNRLMKTVNERCSRARVFVGVGVSPEVADHLAITVIAACRGAGRRGGFADAGSAEGGGSVADEESDELYPRVLPSKERKRNNRGRYVPPPPELAVDRLQETASPQTKRRTAAGHLRQEQLPLEVVSKGRFEKGEPTVLHGEDLDVPTYIRRGVALN